MNGRSSDFFAWQRFFGWARDPSTADLQLFVAVVRTSARLAKQNFPDSHFQVLLWDGLADERLAAIEKALQLAGISVLRISEAIPDLRSNWIHYILSIHDLHPNPLQHDRIADYLVRDLLAE